MRNFIKISEGSDVTPLISLIEANNYLWDQNTLRTKHAGSAHSDVSDIWLLFNELKGDVINDKEVIAYPAWNILYPAKIMVLNIMRYVGAIRIGRVVITRLPPGKSITPHIDQGEPSTYYTRFQIALKSLPGALFNIGEETVNFRTGEVWQINNNIIHSVVNNSADDRIVMIVDLRIE